jgi:hypothetical protein
VKFLTIENDEFTGEQLFPRFLSLCFCVFLMNAWFLKFSLLLVFIKKLTKFIACSLLNLGWASGCLNHFQRLTLPSSGLQSVSNAPWQYFGEGYIL